MPATPLNQSNPSVGSSRMPPPRSPRAEFWRLLRKNRMAFAGLVVFGLFFLIALIGLMLTSGTKPLLDPSTVRLQEKLRPPLSLPHVQTLRPDEVPPLGIYLQVMNSIAPRLSEVVMNIVFRMFNDSAAAVTVRVSDQNSFP